MSFEPNSKCKAFYSTHVFSLSSSYAEGPLNVAPRNSSPLSTPLEIANRQRMDRDCSISPRPAGKCILKHQPAHYMLVFRVMSHNTSFRFFLVNPNHELTLNINVACLRMTISHPY